MVEFSGPSWLLVTSVVTAPEQEVSANEDGAWAFFHRYGYALKLR